MTGVDAGGGYQPFEIEAPELRKDGSVSKGERDYVPSYDMPSKEVHTSNSDDEDDEEEGRRIYLADYIRLLDWNHCSYIYLWLSGAISCLGDSFNVIATTTILARITDSPIIMSMYFIVRMMVPTLMSPISGVVVDSMSYTVVMIATDFARAVTVLCFLFVRDGSMLWALFVVSTVQFALSAFFEPARTAIIPALVDKSELMASNSLDGMTFSTMFFVGSALGGFVTSQFGTDVNFIVDSGSYVLSALFLFKLSRERAKKKKLTEATAKDQLYEPLLTNDGGDTVTITTTDDCSVSETSPPRGSKRMSSEDYVPANVVTDVDTESALGATATATAIAATEKDLVDPKAGKGSFAMYLDGMSYMWRNRDIFILTIFKASGNITLGVAELSNVKMAYHDYLMGQSDGALSLGIQYAIGGVGCIIGPVLVNRYSPPTPGAYRVSMGIAFFFFSVGAAVAGWGYNTAVWLSGNFMVDGGNAIIYVVLTSVLQQDVAEEYRGRVFAFGMAIRTMFSAIGTVGAALLMDNGIADEHFTFILSGCFNFLVFLTWVLVYLPSFFRKQKAKAALRSPRSGRIVDTGAETTTSVN
eukprot:GFYU01012340.1.p1 GENE.GFYU01012340.1~~GFYU01012340.1.p1  ORF type:complete len:585 (+),score=120.16 GFYU01012340.1:141-1895(+)